MDSKWKLDAQFLGVWKFGRNRNYVDSHAGVRGYLMTGGMAKWEGSAVGEAFAYPAGVFGEVSRPGLGQFASPRCFADSLLESSGEAKRQRMGERGGK